MFNMNNTPIYVKGTAELWVHDIVSGDLLGYTNKIDTSNFSSSVNAGEIRAGLGAPVVLNIPDSSAFTGEVTAADFSLQARQLSTGGILKYNGTVMVKETIVCADGKLTVSRTPVAAYGEPSSNTTYSCYVGNDGVNYGVDPSTKEVEYDGQTPLVDGQSYCVMYYIENASAQELAIPTTFAPVVARVTVKMAAYAANGTSSKSSTLAGFVYIHIPRAQFINGNVGIDGSQTTNATTSWSFSALSYDEADETCSVCAMDNSVLGYMVYAPCSGEMSNVQGVVVITPNGANTLTIKLGQSLQIPLYLIMKDGSIVTAQYDTFNYEDQDGKLSISNNGVITVISEQTGGGSILISSKINSDLNVEVEYVVTQ